ncbi:UPF0182 family protein [Thermoproteota archaeon]
MNKRLSFIGLPILIGLAFVIFYIITSLYPDYLWFDSFGFKSIWLFVLQAKILVFLSFFTLTFLWLWLNLKITRINIDKTKPESTQEFESSIPFLNQFFSKLSEPRESQIATLPKKLMNIIIFSGIILISLFLASAAKSWWQEFYAYIHQTAFSITDPLFNKDLSFYVFSLPVYKHIFGWVSGLLFITLFMSGWLYFTNNILIIVFNRNTSNKRIKLHLFILLGLLFSTFAFNAWLSGFGLLFSERGVVFGAGYTDVYAQLFALRLLAILFIIEALLLFKAGFQKSIKLPLYFILFIILTYFLVGKVYPTIVQNYFVAPNEMVKERPFIKNNIELTRFAYNLHKIQETPFPATHKLTYQDIENNPNIINNIRLWNPGPLKQTFRQLQGIRLYYEFQNIDVDRYQMNGNIQQVMLSAREMDIHQLSTQAQTWINKHLVFTHGYGICMAPVSEVTVDGLPRFFIKDLPPVSNIKLSVNQPEIYFGEKESDYVIVNTKQKEFDFPKGDSNVYTTYSGTGGIQLKTLTRRLIYALHFSDLKILISSLIQRESRLLYDRDIRHIVYKIAPFLSYDQDPYLVLTDDGQLIWMIDAYTISNKLPYSEPYSSNVNYIRNAVKITINAYSGETNFYIADSDDPLIITYSKIYKTLFKPFEEMPLTVKTHIRYPRDFFKIQAQMYSTYHMTDPQVFYNREDLWEMPKEAYAESEQIIVMQPYYMVTKLPKEQNESFVLMLPFTPTNKNNMIAWMGAKCDVDEYGKLVVYKFSKERTIYGPMQIESRIDQDTDISQKLTLWGQVGSKVIRGNLLVIPIEESLIYVEPIYLQATQSQLPELKRVIFAYQDTIVMAENLYAAINMVFKQDQQIDIEQYLPEKVMKAMDSDKTLKAIVDEFRQLKLAAKESNWIRFGQILDKIEGLLKDN